MRYELHFGLYCRSKKESLFEVHVRRTVYPFVTQYHQLKRLSGFMKFDVEFSLKNLMTQRDSRFNRSNNRNILHKGVNDFQPIISTSIEGFGSNLVQNFLHLISLAPGVAYWLRHCVTSRKVPGCFPGGVTGDFFRGIPDRTMCPEVDSASESEYQGFLLG